MSQQQFRNMLIGMSAIILLFGFTAGYWTSASIIERNNKQHTKLAQINQSTQPSEQSSGDLPSYNVPTAEQYNGSKSNTTVNAPAIVEITPHPVALQQIRYLIKGNLDKLEVYKINADNEVSLSYVLEVPLDLLPQVDKDKLSAGIEVNSEEELLALIEDYIS